MMGDESAELKGNNVAATASSGGHGDSLATRDGGGSGCCRRMAGKKEKGNQLDVSISGPVYFLIREQAKSLVAIKEIQERMRALEDFQEDVFFTIQELQNQVPGSSLVGQNESFNKNSFPQSVPKIDGSCPLIPSHHSVKSLPHRKTVISTVHRHSPQLRLYTPCNQKVCAPTMRTGSVINVSSSSQKRTLKEAGFVASTTVIGPCISGMGSEVEDSKRTMESDCKQDSGVDSDCRDHGNDASMVPDELSMLLDVIGQRGLLLKKKLQDLEKLQEAPKANNAIEEHQSKQESSSLVVGKLQEENNSLQRRLEEAEKDRDILRKQILCLETASQDLLNEKQRIGKKLEMTVVEKQQLEMHVHNLRLQAAQPATKKAESWPTTDSSPHRERSLGKGKLIFNSSNRAKVSSILQESNVLELQRQVLIHIMENELLQAKLEQASQVHMAKVDEWEQQESRLKDDIRQLRRSKQELVIRCEENKMELATIVAKVRMLERALCDGACNRHQLNMPPFVCYDWLKPQGTLWQPLHPSLGGMGSVPSGTQSLPPTFVAAQAHNQPLINHFLANRKSFPGSESFPGTPIPKQDPAGQKLQFPVNYTCNKQVRDWLYAKGGNFCSSTPITTIFRPASSGALRLPSSLNSDNQSFTGNRPVRHNDMPGVARELYFSDDKDCHMTKSLDYGMAGNSNALRDWHEMEKSDVDSICSEFDPLASSDNEQPKGFMKTYDFIDSLDLSVPLRPSKVVSSSTRNRSDSLEGLSGPKNYLSKESASSGPSLATNKCCVETGMRTPDKGAWDVQQQIQTILDHLSAVADEAQV